MKNLVILSLISIAFLSSCSQGEKAENAEMAIDSTMMYFGDTISSDGAVPSDQLMAMLAGKDSLKIKLSGIIGAVCQKKGCWVDMNIGNDQTMKVRFKDYGFFVPFDVEGKEVILDGYAYNDTTSVEMLKHYAEDAKKSKEEIAKITQPEINIGFEANGVIIKK